MKTKNRFKRGVLAVLAVLTVLAAPLSFASTPERSEWHHVTIVTAPAQYIETCNKDHVCTQHQVSPEYFATRIRVPAHTTVYQYLPTRDLFYNPDGLPAAPRDTVKHIPSQDCVFHGYVLKPGGEVDRYDRKTGMHWRRMCNDVDGHGVISPAVN